MTNTSTRIVITGGTGLIGTHLCRRLIAQGYDVIILTRDVAMAKRRVPNAVDYVVWTPYTHGEWAHALDGALAVIHLAGAPIFGKRWSESYRKEIRESRVVSTRVLFSSMIAAVHKPACFLSGSAIGYYGASDATPLDESAPAGHDFLAHVCVAWEHEAIEAEELGIRTVLLRTGIVLDRDNGALPTMMRPFRFYTGGPILPGSQWMSWIHRDDVIGLILFALQSEDIRGPLNLTAPHPQTNRDLSKTLGRVIRSPSWLPVPQFALKMALGDVSDILVTGQRVMPAKALQHGYEFAYPHLESALAQLLRTP